jgi:hypothetical protein
VRTVQRFRKRCFGASAQHVRRRERDVVRRDLRAPDGGVQHTLHDVIRLIHGGTLAVQHKAVAVDSQCDRKRVFECREILIELSEQPEVIAQRS